MRDDEPVRDVELDEVGAGGDRRLNASSEFSGATGAAPRCATTRGVRRRGAGSRGGGANTTIAQSSARSPPANPRQAASTASATSCAGRPRARGEHLVEPLDAEELAAAPRLDHAVGVEDDRTAGLQLGRDLLVLLRE